MPFVGEAAVAASSTVAFDAFVADRPGTCAPLLGPVVAARTLSNRATMSALMKSVRKSPDPS